MVVDTSAPVAPDEVPVTPRDPADVAAGDAADAPEPTPLSELTLSNGIVLSFRPVPQHLIINAQSGVPKPEVPTFWNENRQRDEPNPDSPIYREAMAQYEADCNRAAQRFALVSGTRFVSAPEGVYGPDDDAWIDEIAAQHDAAGLAMPDIRRDPARPLARYLDWLLYYALAASVDSFIVNSIIFSHSQPTLEAVHRSMANFRRLT